MKNFAAPQKRKRPQCGRSGFSLAELMVAMFVILVGISGVTATIWWGLSVADHGKLIREASDLGRMVVENVVAQSRISLSTGAWPDASSGLNDDASVRRDVFALPLTLSDTMKSQIGTSTLAGENNVSSAVDRFQRNITCTRMSNAALDAEYESSLCTLTVRIFWEDNEAERSISHSVVVPHGKDV